MIPVLQQMFAPTAQAAPAIGTTEGAAAFSGANAIGALETGETKIGDPNSMDGFAAVFTAQIAPKPDAAAKGSPSLAENTDISAEALVDGAAIFAFRLPSLPDQVPPPLTAAETGTTVLPSLVPAALGSTDGAVLPDHLTRAKDVMGPEVSAKIEIVPVLPQQSTALDQTAGREVEQIAPPKTAQAQGAAMPVPATNVPKQIDAGPNLAAQPLDQALLLPQQAMRAQTQSVQETISQPIDQVSQTLPIFSSPTAPSLAESMFHTQIEADTLPTTEAVAAPEARKPAMTVAVLQGEMMLQSPLGKIAVMPMIVEQSIKSLHDPEGTTASSADTMGSDTPNEADVIPNLPVHAPADLAQNLAQDMAQDRGAEGQPLGGKGEVAPMQTTAQSPAPLPYTPATAPQLAAQILPHSQAAKTGPIEVLLNPAELGHLRFEIHQKGEHVQVVLSAERPETLELLRRHGEQLATEFRNAGFAGASLSFGQWGRSSDGQPPASFIAKSDDDIGPTVLPPSVKPPMAQDNSRNLNLRL